MSPLRYCPNCNKNVTTTREDIDIGLAIFLLCCTMGVGFFIYLIVYFSQPETRCIFCSSQTLQPTFGGTSQTTPQFSEEKVVKQTVREPVAEKGSTSSRKYCPLCGTGFTEGQQFCENCGGDLRKI